MWFVDCFLGVKEKAKLPCQTLDSIARLQCGGCCCVHGRFLGRRIIDSATHQDALVPSKGSLSLDAEVDELLRWRKGDGNVGGNFRAGLRWKL